MEEIHPFNLRIMAGKRFTESVKGLNRTHISLHSDSSTTLFKDDDGTTKFISLSRGGINAIAELNNDGNVVEFMTIDDKKPDANIGDMTYYIAGRDTVGVVYKDRTDETENMDAQTRLEQVAWILDSYEKRYE